MNLPNKSRRKELFQNKDYLRTYTQLIEILRKGETNISNNFKIEDSFNLKEIENDKYKFIDIEKDLGYKIIEIDDDLSKKVLNGCKIELNSNESKVILKNKNEIIALYERDNMIYKPLVMLKTNE